MTAKENIAIVNGRELDISTKHAIEICNYIRGKNLLESKTFLEDVLAKRKAVPFRRFNGDVGHRAGKVGPGRYPEKACKTILKLLESLEVNAQNKGLDTAALFLKEVIPNKASNVMRYGRQRRRQRKLTHIYLLAEEAVKKEKSLKERKKKPKEEKEVQQKKDVPTKEVAESNKSKVKEDNTSKESNKEVNKEK